MRLVDPSAGRPRSWGWESAGHPEAEREFVLVGLHPPRLDTDVVERDQGRAIKPGEPDHPHRGVRGEMAGYPVLCVDTNVRACQHAIISDRLSQRISGSQDHT